MQHLALAVRDEARSRAFYETYFGFGAAQHRRAPDGVLILRNRDGFDLALGPSSGEATVAPFLHFGIRVVNRGQVRRLAKRLVADGVGIVERSEEDDYASVKCLDPDGYLVEAYWDSW